MLVLISSYVVIKVYFTKKENVRMMQPKYIINGDKLVKEFLENEERATKKYTNEVIKVYGAVKNISYINNRKTIILSSVNDNSGIICDLDITEDGNLMEIKKNQMLHIKGKCKGFLKDVILLNCSIETLKTNE